MMSLLFAFWSWSIYTNFPTVLTKNKAHQVRSVKLSYIWDFDSFITQPFILSILRNASPSYVPIPTSILSSIVVSVFVSMLLWCVTSGWMYTRWWHKVNITWVSILRTSTHTSSWVLHLCFSGTVIALRMVPGIRRVNQFSLKWPLAILKRSPPRVVFLFHHLPRRLVFIHSSRLTVCCWNDEQFSLDLSFLIEISNFLFKHMFECRHFLFSLVYIKKKPQVIWYHFYLIRLVFLKWPNSSRIRHH